MVTAYYTHACFLGHDPGPGHPERADRIRAIWQALDAPEFKDLARREPPEATPSNWHSVTRASMSTRC